MNEQELAAIATISLRLERLETMLGKLLGSMAPPPASLDTELSRITALAGVNPAASKEAMREYTQRLIKAERAAKKGKKTHAGVHASSARPSLATV